MSTAAGTSATWPADIIHVNEDGWVLINRGSQHGVQAGLRLLVVGQGIRELRNLFAPGSDDAEGTNLPTMLRIRRTYEQLEVIHAEADCAIAVATRTPASRRPSVYTGPEGELLVWVPLPEGWTWPHPGEDDVDNTTEEDVNTDTGWQAGAQNSSDAADDGSENTDDSQGTVTDVPPERGEQDDERWEEALPLNGVSVGDIVVPALPAIRDSATATASNSSDTTATISAGSSFEQGRDYDWMKSNQ